MNNEKITETYDVLKTFIPKEDIYLNEPMSKHTTFKIGGNADIFVKLKSVDRNSLRCLLITEQLLIALRNLLNNT